MKIIVCIKQIPDTNDVKWSKDNNIIRDGVISVLNKCDLYAINAIREIKNAEITYLSMGPLSACKSLEYALALGGGKGAYLLSDKKFSGADTLATAKTISYVIRNYIKEFDLVVTGQYASDGDTGQTPYSLANILGIEHIGYVTEIKNADESGITAVSVKDEGIYTIYGKFPLVISLLPSDKEIYKPLSADYIRAADIGVEILNAALIGADENQIGLKGSPTQVIKAFRPENKRECKFITKDELITEFNVWKS
ncbi:MAG: electron transfer flavoprotein subunit beta/FixA family protein [Candidatus Gastranaerophilales bacterium]|nr:electron transfer flavoprotein subunit beta/FixA family protein [Candidatus Gastranaerophilales bacterium]